VILLLTSYVRSEATIAADVAEGVRAADRTALEAMRAYGRLLGQLTEAERFPALHAVIAAGVFDGRTTTPTRSSPSASSAFSTASRCSCGRVPGTPARAGGTAQVAPESTTGTVRIITIQPTSATAGPSVQVTDGVRSPVSRPHRQVIGEMLGEMLGERAAA
jgi:hypothetical protein